MNLGRPDRVRTPRRARGGLCAGHARRAGRRRRLDRIAQTDPTVAAAVRGWEWRLAALTEGMPGITPPLHVWEGIRKRLGLSGEPDSTRSQAAPWWASLSLWRGLALAGFALAFALGATAACADAPSARSKASSSSSRGPTPSPRWWRPPSAEAATLTVKAVAAGRRAGRARIGALDAARRPGPGFDGARARLGHRPRGAASAGRRRAAGHPGARGERRAGRADRPPARRPAP